jgi:hypothetical protein
MYSNKWGILGINFTQPLSFSGMTGSFRIVGPVTVNDFSYYQYSDSKLSQSYIARPWSNLTTTKWSTWSTLYTWNDLLKISNPAIPATNLLNLYNIYTGSNRYVTEFDGTKLFTVQTGINNFVSNTEKLTGILSPV